MNLKNLILKFFKYLVISLLILSLISFVFLCIHSFDRFIYIYNLNLKDLLYYNFLALLTSLISYFYYSICISSFISFRKVPFSSYLQSIFFVFLSIIPLIVLALIYTCNISPVINKNIYASIWKAKSREELPSYIVDNKSNFMRSKTLSFKLDSIEQNQVSTIMEARKLYSKLPLEMRKTFEEKANYMNLNLKDFTENTEISPDSLSTYYQFSDKYDEIYENYGLIRTFKIDLYTRYIPILVIPVLLLIFSILGSYLKKESIHKILVIIAVVIISIFVLYYINYFIKECISNIVALQ